MKIKWKWNNTDRVMAKLKALEKSAPQAVVIGLVAAGERIMSDAVERVPVDTGRLRQTAYVAPPEALGTTEMVVEAGFGTSYAIPVHEKTNVSHTHGEAKFLEKAVHKRGQGSLHIVAKVAEKYLEKGGKAKPTKFPTRPEEK